MDADQEPSRTGDPVAQVCDHKILIIRLRRKLRNIPIHIVPPITFDYVLRQSARVTHTPSVPSDIQLPFLLRNRALIDRHRGRPVKDEKEQSMKITRAIFFYHIDDTHHFQRFHDASRWNIALFAALLCLPKPDSPNQSSCNPQASVPEAQQITPSARCFTISYLAAVVERHNTPTWFDKREEFVRLWKKSKWTLFESFAAGQRKFLKKRMQISSMDWEIELDVVLREFGREEYDIRVAPLVGCLVPGRKDQGMYREHLIAAPEPFSLLREAVDGDMDEEKNELLEALRVPLDIDEQSLQDGYGHGEDARTPVDLSYAITLLCKVKPTKILKELMRLFPAT